MGRITKIKISYGCEEGMLSNLAYGRHHEADKAHQTDIDLVVCVEKGPSLESSE